MAVLSKPMGFPSYNNPTGTDHGKLVVGTQLAHNVLPWIHRIFSNFKAWEIGVYHGLRAKHLQSCLDPASMNSYSVSIEDEIDTRD